MKNRDSALKLAENLGLISPKALSEYLELTVIEASSNLFEIERLKHKIFNYKKGSAEHINR